MIPSKISPFKAHLEGLNGYVGGQSVKDLEKKGKKVYKLSSNENPIGPSPKAMEALQRSITDLHIYPDNTAIRLQSALSEFFRHKFEADQVIVGNSGSEVLELIARGFLDSGTEYIYSEPCFSPYKMFSGWQGAKGIEVPLLSPDFSLDLGGILNAVNERTRVLFLTSPNNPTGTYIPREMLVNLLDQLPTHVIVVLDEVYHHFADEPTYTTAVDFVGQGYPIIGINSFSKTYGLAGMRLGYGYSTPEIARYLRQLCRPFLVNSLALEVGIAALQDTEFVAETVQLIQQERERLYPILDTLPLQYWKTQGNFYLVRPEMPVVHFQNRLLEQGIMVREMKSFGAPGCVRITIGNREANDALVKALERILR